MADETKEYPLTNHRHRMHPHCLHISRFVNRFVCDSRTLVRSSSVFYIDEHQAISNGSRHIRRSREGGNVPEIVDDIVRNGGLEESAEERLCFVFYFEVFTVVGQQADVFGISIVTRRE